MAHRVALAGCHCPGEKAVLKRGILQRTKGFIEQQELMKDKVK